MLNSPREEWPMPSYMEAWKTFRSMSDENVATARHLVTRTLWPRRDELVICDVGCGDGRLLEELMIHSPKMVAEARLLDPDAKLLREAEDCVSERRLASKVVPVHSTAEESFLTCATGADVILAIHLVYLLKDGALQKMLAECPLEKPIYVVMDAPHSVFTELWRRTATKYYDRAMRAHETIQGLSPNQFYRDVSGVNSLIGNPLLIQRPDLQAKILSILSYRDMSDPVDEALYQWVRETVSNHAAGNSIECESVCYELERRS